jgi:hypothetical protein
MLPPLNMHLVHDAWMLGLARLKQHEMQQQVLVQAPASLHSLAAM